MKLQLHHTDNIQHKATAALIRGGDAGTWLAEISRWEVNTALLDCYIIPTSIDDISPAGLFVVIHDDEKSATLDLLDAYFAPVEKLYIPVGATLYPDVTTEELTKLLLWHVQVFHPSIGFIGFEEKDRIELADLIIATAPNPKDWGKASKGIEPRPMLHAIEVLKPTPAEMLEAVRKDIDTKPLDEIPGLEDDKSSSPFGKMLDTVKYGLAKGLHGLAEQLSYFSQGSGGNGDPMSPGLMQQLMDWAAKNMDLIEKKRRDELQRLLDLFDEDTAEALKYALPLNSPYFDRGKAPPTAKLGKRDVNFNARNLGGGNRGDTWDVGNYYGDLRSKYLRAAQKEIERKEYKKAAYIYAHLLGDYHAAANALVQGGFYREAAILYKDHLNNTSAAAECLEKGGLLLEAIELYDGLQKTEKIGDLYKQLEEGEKAGVYYEKTVSKALERRDYLDASRVLKDKKQETDRAKGVLLDGWNDYNQAEACLKNYYELSATGGDEKLAEDIQQVYKKHTPEAKRTNFLNVLTHVNLQSGSGETLDVSRDIAYEIISAETSAGNLSIAHQLKNFFPEDRLVASDSSRFVTGSGRHKAFEKSKPAQTFHLEKDIHWICSAQHRNQFILLGLKNGVLHLARGNWYGYVEYYSWQNIFQKNDHFKLVAGPYQSANIIIQTTSKFYLEDKTLPKNKHFDEAILVCQPAWLPKENAGICYNGDGVLTVLKTDTISTLYTYQPNGQLDKWIECKTTEPVAFSGHNTLIPPPLVFHGGYFYAYHGKTFIGISTNGDYVSEDMGTGIRLMGASYFSHYFFFVLSTNKGCIACRAKAQQIDWRSSYFAEDMIPSSITFIASDRFVMAEKNKAIIFSLEGEKITAINEVTASSIIVSVLKSNNRNQFALLEQAGMITLHNIEKD